MSNIIRRTIKTQLGKSCSADFEDNTWTFSMPEKYQVAAGDFYIVDKPIYDELLKAASDVLDEFSYGGKIPDAFADAMHRLQFLVKREQEVQVCDATDDDSSNKAD